MTTTWAAPVVATAGDSDPAAPLVVLLHGRGSHEQEIIALAEHLPAGPAYAAVRAPIAEGGGYAWFANRGIGRPVAGSLRATMDWFWQWLDEVAPPGRPVVLIGFSGGAAFAGGLLLDDPDRYAGGAVLYGTLPFEAGVPTTPARLAGVPVVVAQGEHDSVIPRELLDRTWSYLLGESGAPTVARRDPVGHGISAEALATLAGWLRERLTFLAHRGRPAAGPATWAALPGGRLPTRAGARPAVTSGIPQEQRSDTAPVHLQEEVFARIAALPGVGTRQSAISVPGARGFQLAPPRLGPVDAFIVPSAGEFAHVHPGSDGSLHVALPPALAADVVAKGWGVAHPLAGVRLTPGMVLLFGPRDPAELQTVVAVVTTSHAWATGQHV
ncbi:phospholipase/carboxylesterase [Geodermatophilus obscurus]|uniref:Phospholipase/carboxylesterase n=1 Tax=Geodermatophilus obscurus TaxID=1861 RepID=A0A1M7SNH8_9ACTN|nr:luciferase family protein [Geodermatophilus obscurus]SHN60020.1 phospholipase/carboxylesterase [Geodermatophilus obscurus]